MISLSIIILTYNSSRHINTCLESINKYYKKDFDAGWFELIVFDNASSDDTFNIAKTSIEHFGLKNSQIIRNKNNSGFARGINQAVKYAKGKYLLFLNPDTECENANITKMIELMDSNKEIKVTGGKILDYNGQVEKSSSRFYTLWPLLIWTLGIEELVGFRTSPQVQKAVDYVSGGFMLVERTFFEHQKGFDERFFMYMEDMEFCYRVKKLGYQIWFVPYARIKHRGQGSSDSGFAIMQIFNGILLFHKKHSNKLEIFFVKILLLKKAFFAMVFSIAFLNYKKARIYLPIIGSLL